MESSKADAERVSVRQVSSRPASDDNHQAPKGGKRRSIRCCGFSYSSEKDPPPTPPQRSQSVHSRSVSTSSRSHLRHGGQSRRASLDTLLMVLVKRPGTTSQIVAVMDSGADINVIHKRKVEEFGLRILPYEGLPLEPFNSGNETNIMPTGQVELEWNPLNRKGEPQGEREDGVLLPYRHEFLVVDAVPADCLLSKSLLGRCRLLQRGPAIYWLRRLTGR